VIEGERKERERERKINTVKVSSEADFLVELLTKRKRREIGRTEKEQEGVN